MDAILRRMFSVPLRFGVATCILMGWSVSVGWSQNAEYSPYSRFGFGLVGTLQTPVSAGLGGMESVMFSNYQFNPNNPATASALGQTTLQASGTSTSLSMREGAASNATAQYGSAGPIGLAIKKQGGSNTLIIGASPYSNSGYAITRTSEFDGIGTIQERYDGSGGLTKAHIGWAHTIKNKGYVSAGPNDSILIQKSVLHTGIQTQYLFGEVTRTAMLDVVDVTFLDHRARVESQHRSLSANIGVIYDHLLYAKYQGNRSFEKSASMRFGLLYTPQSNLTSEFLSIDETTQNLGGIDIPLDTAFFDSSDKFLAQMPASWTIGMSLMFNHANGRRLAFGAEYGETQWGEVSKSFAPYLQVDDMEWIRSSASRASLEWTPGNTDRHHPTWGKGTYRLGISRVIQPYEISGSPIVANTVSGGFSIPLVGSRSLSRLHFGMEIGERSAGDGSLEETYARMHIGFSLMPFFKNNWLKERLYD